MPFNITTKGYIVVMRDGAIVSRHSIETEAIESCLSHAEKNGSGKYIFLYPNKEFTVTLAESTPKVTGIITGNVEIA